jgi:chaperonin cofactor prefoldin
VNRVRVCLSKTILTVYRYAAVAVLYGILIGVACYLVSVGFFAVCSSWIAPFRVSPTSDKILDMNAKMVESQQSLNNLIVDRDKLQSGLDDMKRIQKELTTLDGDFRHALSREQAANLYDAPALSSLNAHKYMDNAQTVAALQEAALVEAQIDKDLAAGMITKGDAAIQKLQLRQSKNQSTDGQIGEVLLRDNVRMKSSGNTQDVDELTKVAELKMNLSQVSVAISSGEEQLRSDLTQIEQLQTAITTARQSPYYLATKGNVQFAFVSYDNEPQVFQGAPVYSCVFEMIVCHKVGIVKTIFGDEEQATHPVYHTPLRGHLVQLELTEPNSAKHMVLFVGRRPLFF